MASSLLELIPEGGGPSRPMAASQRQAEPRSGFRAADSWSMPDAFLQLGSIDDLPQELVPLLRLPEDVLDNLDRDDPRATEALERAGYRLEWALVTKEKRGLSPHRVERLTGPATGTRMVSVVGAAPGGRPGGGGAPGAPYGGGGGVSVLSWPGSGSREAVAELSTVATWRIATVRLESQRRSPDESSGSDVPVRLPLMPQRKATSLEEYEDTSHLCC